MTGSLKTVVQLLFNTSVIWQTLKLCLVIQRTFWDARKVRMSEQREKKHNYGEGILFSKQTFHTTWWRWPREPNICNFLAVISEGEAGEKEQWITLISIIFPHTGERFPCLLRKPVINGVLIKEPTLLLLLEVSSTKQMLLWPQERAPYKLFLILLDHIHVGQREDPFSCTVL